MSVRAWLDLPEAPRADADGVLAETTLRAELWPRLLAAAWALLDRYPPAPAATVADRARWARVLAVGAALDRGEAAVAVHELAALEQLAGVREA